VICWQESLVFMTTRASSSRGSAASCCRLYGGNGSGDGRAILRLMSYLLPAGRYLQVAARSHPDEARGAGVQTFV